jgi:hypothetical protein
MKIVSVRTKHVAYFVGRQGIRGVSAENDEVAFKVVLCICVRRQTCTSEHNIRAKFRKHASIYLKVTDRFKT